jgi:hypothetical protein
MTPIKLIVAVTGGLLMAPLEVGIAIPSSLCRYTNSAWSGFWRRDPRDSISIGPDVAWE